MIPGLILRWSRIEVITWSLMVGLGESYIGAYALACGLSERYAGLILTLPLAIGSILQLFSGYFLRWMQNRRHFVILCATLQALTLFMVAGHGALDRGSPTLLLVVLTLYWLFGLSAGPVWNTWIVSLIPINKRANFFSMRGPYHEISVLIALVIGGYLLSISKELLVTFVFMFCTAGFFRLISVFSLYKLPNEQSCNHPTPSSALDWKAFSNWIRQKQVLWILIVVSMFHLGIHIGSPFFTPFMLKQLNLDYKTYMLLIAVPFLSRALAYSYFERIMQRWGIKKTLIPIMIILTLNPSLWAHFPYVETIFIFQVVGGIAWAGFEYGILLKQISEFSHIDRSRILTWTNFFVGLCSIVGVTIGSEILKQTPTFSNYVDIFHVSSVVRFIPILFIFLIDWQIPKEKIKTTYLRLLGVRVSRGAVSKPILYADKANKNSN